jgi:hypothetical protein
MKKEGFVDEKKNGDFVNVRKRNRFLITMIVVEAIILVLIISVFSFSFFRKMQGGNDLSEEDLQEQLKDLGIVEGGDSLTDFDQFEGVCEDIEDEGNRQVCAFKEALPFWGIGFCEGIFNKEDVYLSIGGEDLRVDLNDLCFMIATNELEEDYCEEILNENIKGFCLEGKFPD